MCNQEKGGMEEDCMEEEKGKSHREQETIVENTGGQVCPVKVKWI